MIQLSLKGPTTTRHVVDGKSHDHVCDRLRLRPREGSGLLGSPFGEKAQDISPAFSVQPEPRILHGEIFYHPSWEKRGEKLG